MHQISTYVFLILLFSCQNEIQFPQCTESAEKLTNPLQINKLEQMVGTWHLKTQAPCEEEFNALMIQRNQVEKSYQELEMIFSLKIEKSTLVLDGPEDIDMGLQETVWNEEINQIDGQMILSDKIQINQLQLPDLTDDLKDIKIKEIRIDPITDTETSYGQVEYIQGRLFSQSIYSYPVELKRIK